MSHRGTPTTAVKRNDPVDIRVGRLPSNFGCLRTASTSLEFTNLNSGGEFEFESVDMLSAVNDKNCDACSRCVFDGRGRDGL